jgi:hypothetical protein
VSRSVRKQELIQIPLTAGMDQSADELMAPLGTLKRVTNMRAVAGGFLRKRVGYTTFTGAVPTSAYPVVDDETPEKPTFLSRIGDANVLGISSGAIFALDETNGGSRFQYIGRHSTATPIKATTAQLGGDLIGGAGGFGRTPGAVAINSKGYVVVAAVNDGSELQGYIESPDGVRVWRVAGVTATKVQCLAVGETLFVIYQNGTAINAMRLVPSSSGINYGSGGVTASVATLTGASAYWDTSAYDGTNWYIVYQNGAAQCTVALMTDRTATTTATFAVTGTVPLSITALTDYPSANAVWVGYYDNPTVTGDVGYLVYPAPLGTPTLAKTTIISSANIYGPPLWGPYYCRTAPATDRAFAVYRIANTNVSLMHQTVAGVYDVASGLVQGPAALNNVLPISKPDARMRFWVTVDSGSAHTNLTLSQHFLVRWEPIGAVFSSWYFIELSTRRFPWPGTTYGTTAKYDYFHAPAVGDGVLAGTRRALMPLPIVLNMVSAYPFMSIELYEYSLAEFESHRAVLRMAQGILTSGSPTELYGQVLNDLYTTSGAHQVLAESGAAEVGWSHAPIIFTDSNGGAGNVAPGTYSYKAVYEWVDQYGRRHLSAPSAPYSVTVTTAGFYQLLSATGNATQRYNSAGVVVPRIVFYRTLAGGTSYKRLPGYQSAFGIFTDNYSDAQIAGNESLYTDGGVFPNVLAPSCQFFAQTEDRLVCGGLWDPTIVHFSKIQIPGEQTAFSEDAAFQVPLFAPCTGLAYMDGATVAFTRDSILLISGEGPNDQGVGAFSTRYLTKELGCVNYRTIIETNTGILFQSEDGYYLLPRGFGPPQAVGNAVRKEVHGGNSARCLSACAITDEVTPDEGGGSTYAVWLTDDGAGTAIPQTPQFDAQATGGESGGDGAFSFSHALGGGANRRVFVGAHFSAGSNPVTGCSATYNGVAMVALTSSAVSTDEGLYVFQLPEASLPVAGTYTVQITFTVSGGALGRFLGECVSVYDCYQGSLTTAVAAGASTTPSVNITTTDDDSLILDLGGNVSNVALTPGAAQTERVDTTAGTLNRIFASTRAVTSPTSYTMSWTKSGSDLWRLAAIELPVAALPTPVCQLLVYDTGSGQWFRDSLGSTMAEIGAWTEGLALATASMDTDIESAPIRYQDNLTNTTDDGATYIQGRIETAIYHPFGLGGWGAVKQVVVVFVGSNFVLNVDSYVNGSATPQHSTLTVANGEDGLVRYFYVSLETDKLSSIRFDIYDTENSGDDTSFGLLGVALEASDSGGLRLVETGERA